MRRLAILTVLAALAAPAARHAGAQPLADRTSSQCPAGYACPYDDRRGAGYDRDRYDPRRDRYDRGPHGRDVGGLYPRDRYDRFDRSAWGRHARERWVPLATDVTVRTPQARLELGRSAGRFQAIRIEAARGAPAIRGLYIQFADGRWQWVALGAQLRRGAGEVIDLRGDRRRVERIIVYGDPRSRGTYSVFAG